MSVHAMLSGVIMAACVRRDGARFVPVAGFLSEDVAKHLRQEAKDAKWQVVVDARPGPDVEIAIGRPLAADETYVLNYDGVHFIERAKAWQPVDFIRFVNIDKMPREFVWVTHASLR